MAGLLAVRCGRPCCRSHFWWRSFLAPAHPSPLDSGQLPAPTCSAPPLLAASPRSRRPATLSTTPLDSTPAGWRRDGGPPAPLHPATGWDPDSAPRLAPPYPRRWQHSAMRRNCSSRENSSPDGAPHPHAPRSTPRRRQRVPARRSRRPTCDLTRALRHLRRQAPAPCPAPLPDFTRKQLKEPCPPSGYTSSPRPRAKRDPPACRNTRPPRLLGDPHPPTPEKRRPLQCRPDRSRERPRLSRSVHARPNTSSKQASARRWCAADSPSPGA